LLGAQTVFSQVGIGTTNPNPNALLDIDATTIPGGLLLPRIALTNATSPAPLSAHVPGMVVYNTATVADVVPGFYFNDGGDWVRVDAAIPPSDDWTTGGNAGTVPGTQFIGTTDNQPLRFRTNNSDRIEITNNGRLRSFSNGNAAQPSYSFTADPDIGMYRIGTNSFGFSSSGIERLRIGSNGNISINKGANGLSSAEVVEATNSQGGIYSNITHSNSNWSAIEGYNPNTTAGAGVIATGYTGMYGQGRFGIYGRGVFGIYGEPINLASDWAGYFAGDANVDRNLWVNGMTVTPSDSRIKQNIKDINDATAIIKKLRPVNYDKVIDKKNVILNIESVNPIKATGKRPISHHQIEYGLLAQEVELVLPQLVQEKQIDYKDSEITSLKGVNYVGLIPILIKAVQEQQVEIELLKKEIETLKTRGK